MSAEQVKAIKSQKNWLVYSTILLIIVTLIPAALQDIAELSLPQFVFMAIYVAATVLWLTMMFFIFRVNYLISNLGHALFRVVISIIPILALYVVYRTSYEANQYVLRSEQGA